MARMTRVRWSLPAMRSSTASARSGWPENIKMAASSATSSSASGGEVMTATAAALMVSAVSGWPRPQCAFLALVTASRNATGSLAGSSWPRTRTRSEASKTPSSYSASPSSRAPAASSCSAGIASISRRTTRKSCALRASAAPRTKTAGSGRPPASSRHTAIRRAAGPTAGFVASSRSASASKTARARSLGMAARITLLYRGWARRASPSSMAIVTSPDRSSDSSTSAGATASR